MIARYRIDLFRSDEDGAWVADVPDREFCSAFGDTPGEPAIPEPRYRGAKQAAD